MDDKSKRRGEPVAWMTEDGRVCSAETRDTAMPNVSRVLFNIPLYRAPQPAEPVKVRKAFICPNCEGVYADQSVSQCDCVPEKNEFIEGTISYPSDVPTIKDSSTVAEPVKVLSDEDFDGWAEDIARLGYNANVEGVEHKLREFYACYGAQPAASAELVRVRDESQPIYLDGVECQYSIEKGDPWPYSETVAYVFEREAAELIAAALNAAPVAAQPSVPEPLKYGGNWKDHYVTGWNNCRAAMLAAEQTQHDDPTPEEEEAWRQLEGK